MFSLVKLKSHLGAYVYVWGCCISLMEWFLHMQFEDARDAEDAIRGRDGYNFDGNRLRVWPIPCGLI